MKSLKNTRAPAVTLAAYLALAGSMVYAVTASAAQTPVDSHSQHSCVAEHSVADANTEADTVALESNAALAPDQVDVQAAAQAATPAVKTRKPARRKNQVESSLFHF